MGKNLRRMVGIGLGGLRVHWNWFGLIEAQGLKGHSVWSICFIARLKHFIYIIREQLLSCQQYIFTLTFTALTYFSFTLSFFPTSNRSRNILLSIDQAMFLGQYLDYVQKFYTHPSLPWYPAAIWLKYSVPCALCPTQLLLLNEAWYVRS